jgi:hypothetical protein
MADQHCWTEDDDLVAFYLSNHDPTARFLGFGYAVIAKALSGRPPPEGCRAVDMPVGSLSMRVQNFDYLAGRPGLPKYAAQSERIHEQYKNTTVIETRPMVVGIIGLPVRDAVERKFKDFCDRFAR